MDVVELFSDSEESGEEMSDADWVPVKVVKGAKKSMMGVRSSCFWLVITCRGIACLYPWRSSMSMEQQWDCGVSLLFWTALIWQYCWHWLFVKLCQKEQKLRIASNTFLNNFSLDKSSSAMTYMFLSCYLWLVWPICSRQQQTSEP